jgi:hypothetical protein
MIASAATTLSGIAEINMNGSDADGDAGDLRGGTGDVLFGIVSESELTNGLIGYGSIRLDVDNLSNPEAGNDSPSPDNIYAGIKGGFGDIRIGEVPLAVEYGQTANDIFDVGAELDGALSYTGSFGPASVVLNFSPPGNATVRDNAEALGIGAKVGFGGFTLGAGAETRTTSAAAATASSDDDDLLNAAVGISFAYAGASINAHFWTQEAPPNSGGDLESMSVQAGYGFSGISAVVTFSTLQNDASVDQDAIRLDLSYGLGGGTTLSTRITANGDNNDSTNDLTEFRVQLAKSF